MIGSIASVPTGKGRAPPDIYLRAPSFISSERWNPERIGAVVLYCSDGRWGEAFDEFCHRCLLIPRYDRWAVPGGPVCLLPSNSGDGYCRGVWEQLDFLVSAHQLRRIVLIAHYGCAYYTELHGTEPDECLPAQVEDLQAATNALRVWFPDLELQSYLAMRGGAGLSFHAVDTS